MAAQQIDFSKTWNDTVKLMTTNREFMMILGGVFFLLPALAALYLGAKMVQIDNPTPAQTMAMFTDWFDKNAIWFLLQVIAGLIGGTALNILLLDNSRPTVGEALRRSLPLAPTIFVARILGGIAVFLGLLCLLLPGIYFAIKLSLTDVYVADNTERNPIAALQGSWRRTKGNSIYIFGFLFVLAIVAVIAFIAITVVANLILLLLLPASIAPVLVLFFNAVVQAMLTLLFLCVYVAIYRQLSAPEAANG